MEKIYLDYAATTPVDERVIGAMKPYFSGSFGNPGSLHSFGQEAIAAIDASRQIVADSIGAEFGDVVFTGSATEANNLALRGSVRNYFREEKKIPHIISTAIEHESVFETLKDLEKQGEASVAFLPVDPAGRVRAEDLKKALRPETALVSVIYANNETGIIQSISELSKTVKDFNHEILFHTDAVQAFQYLDCRVNELGVDLMTLSAHKIYGPKGVGALYVRGRGISPVTTGGGQEFGLRSGTENSPGIVGFAKAAEIAAGMRTEEKERVAELRGYFWRELKKVLPAAEVNGGEAVVDDSLSVLPNILNIRFSGRRGADLLVKLDKAGIAVSAGSACQARSVKPSHVLLSMGLSEEEARSSLRFSFGRRTDKDQLDKVIGALKTLG